MSEEVKELREQVAKLKRENESLEDNFQLVVGPYGTVGKEIKKLSKRVTVLEEQMKKIIETRQNKKSKE